jgi:hypothetical protein
MGVVVLVQGVMQTGEDGGVDAGELADDWENVVKRADGLRWRVGMKVAAGMGEQEGVEHERERHSLGEELVRQGAIGGARAARRIG